MTLSRRQTVQVSVGTLGIGSDHPIRVQSMTTTNTMDTEATIAQSIRMINAGCELVRITAPSQREAHNLAAIKEGLRSKGYNTPLVADIHYTPNAAEIAARIVEKVRVNPGNYVDKKMFAVLDYNDASYQAELDRIRTRFTPLVRICKEHGTAMRIGTNHGSLSDRIVNRYGDNPEGMVQSAIEFLRICEDEGFRNVVVSMKSSNPIVMVEAYRLFVQRNTEAGLPPYPLHLGVTEAGDGNDGRIKSAIGIGMLVDEGLGDTIRVSLTEEPEAEIPVAFYLASRVAQSCNNGYTPFQKRQTNTVANVGGEQLPRVVADVSNASIVEREQLAPFGHKYDINTDKWFTTDQPAEYLYTGQSPLPFSAPAGIRQWVDADVWHALDDRLYNVPVFTPRQFEESKSHHPVMNGLAFELERLGDVARGVRGDVALFEPRAGGDELEGRPRRRGRKGLVQERVGLFVVDEAVEFIAPVLALRPDVVVVGRHRVHRQDLAGERVHDNGGRDGCVAPDAGGVGQRVLEEFADVLLQTRIDGEFQAVPGNRVAGLERLDLAPVCVLLDRREAGRAAQVGFVLLFEPVLSDRLVELVVLTFEAGSILSELRADVAQDVAEFFTADVLPARRDGE